MFENFNLSLISLFEDPSTTEMAQRGAESATF